MSGKGFIFTSESVSEGHPDKICDRISDAIVDRFLGEDPHSRVAVETLTTTNRIVLAGEVRGPASITADVMEEIARNCVREIGYEQDGFHWKNLDFKSFVHAQSQDIAQGVDAGASKDEGAGDQGIMFGYACNENAAHMPTPLYVAHRILRKLADDRRAGKLPQLGPDAKSQISLLYQDGKPVKATSIVVSTQHVEGVSQKDVRDIVRPYVLEALPFENWMCDEDDFYVNPTGRFVIGGPDGDAGLTGRKIIVDTYGGAAMHGGGAFSGKDPSKVDRSAAYIARYMAKNVVVAGLADKCEIQLSYAIGVSKPLSLYVNLRGTGRVDERAVEKALWDLVDLSPRGIRERLQLNRPIYERTAAYGHFGRKPEDDGAFSWEQTDLAEELRSVFGVTEDVAAAGTF